MAAEQDVWSRSMKHGLRLNAAIVARTVLLTSQVRANTLEHLNFRCVVCNTTHAAEVKNVGGSCRPQLSDIKNNKANLSVGIRWKYACAVTPAGVCLNLPTSSSRSQRACPFLWHNRTVPEKLLNHRLSAPFSSM